MEKEVRLYNAMFPIWLLILFPPFWIIAMIVNYIIDRLVLRYALRRMQVEDIKGKVKKAIWKTWIAGFGADFIGGFGMFIVANSSADYDKPLGTWWNNNMRYGVFMNPFDNIFAFMYTSACVVLSGYFIYRFNKNWCLKTLDLSDDQIHMVALMLAVLTAPFLFYFPTRLFYRILWGY